MSERRGDVTVCAGIAGGVHATVREWSFARRSDAMTTLMRLTRCRALRQLRRRVRRCVCVCVCVCVRVTQWPKVCVRVCLCCQDMCTRYELQFELTLSSDLPLRSRYCERVSNRPTHSSRISGHVVERRDIRDVGQGQCLKRVCGGSRGDLGLHACARAVPTVRARRVESDVRVPGLCAPPGRA